MILKDEKVRLLTPGELNIELEVEENGETYLENSLKKARAFHQASGLPVLADDSGLEVDWLGGQPGIHSRRFLPNPDASSHERCLYLLSRLKDYPKPWKAHFNCVAVLYLTEERWKSSCGQIYGEISEAFSGNQGFGFDPIFFIPELKQTMAELLPNQKNQISHRALALLNFTELFEWLQS